MIFLGASPSSTSDQQCPTAQLSPAVLPASSHAVKVCSHEKQRLLRRPVNHSTMANTTDVPIPFTIDLFTVLGCFRHNKLLDFTLVMRHL